MTWPSNGYTCLYCGKWVGGFEQHYCYKPISDQIIKYISKSLSEYTTQELLDELKKRKEKHAEKVEELKKEIELLEKLPVFVEGSK